MNKPLPKDAFMDARPMTSPDKSTDSGLCPAAPKDHPAIASAKIGVLLVNLGTPEGTDPASVRRYLREFLSDRRVVDYPRFAWMPLLHGIILNTRPAKTGKAYAKIWREESNESPLRYFTRAQAEHMTEQLRAHDTHGVNAPTMIIDWAMRYGVPSIRDRMHALIKQGCTRVLIVPLYPQYSATTTGTVNDEVFRTLMDMPWQPALRTAPAFHDDPAYIEALRAVTQRHLDSLDFVPERMIMSFHGLPERYFREGDPYHCHCAKTARLLREAMGWSEEFAPLAFQSKFGPEKWLGPSTDDTIERLADEGVKNLAIMTPGFVADCIETLEEIAMEGRDTFFEAGGQHFTAVPCLNDSEEMTNLIQALVAREIAGWA